MSIDPSAVIGSISAAIGFAKELVDINKAVDQAQWKLKLAELTSMLADAKMGAVEMQMEIQSRNKEIARLKESFAFREKTIEKHGMLYEMRDGRPVGMPFCPRCATVDGLFIKLTALQKEGKPSRCPQCKSDFERQTEYLFRDEK